MLAIFLDIEATGLDPTRHQAIDLALKAIDVTEGKERGSYQAIIKISPEAWERRDPVSMQINGYTWETVSQGKESFAIREEIIPLFKEWGFLRGKGVFICQNPSFDRSFFTQIVDVYMQENLNWPYHWLDFASMFWAFLVKKTLQENSPFPETLNLSKNAIAQLYQLPPEPEPHRAMNGVEHLICCYKKVVGWPLLSRV